MSAAQDSAPGSGHARPVMARAIVRVIGLTALFILLYYVLPFDRLSHVWLFVALGLGIVALLTFASWHIWSIINSDDPSLQAVEGFLIIVSLFLVLVAAWYYAISRAYPHSFTSGRLTHTDALYFAVTVFSTVGFGDISAASQLARVFVTIQMVLDLVILGLGIRILTRAVKVGAARHGASGAASGE